MLREKDEILIAQELVEDPAVVVVALFDGHPAGNFGTACLTT